jgi:zinc transport system ATP-binding protein
MNDLNEIILRVENLSFAYEQEQILRNVNFHIHKGDFISVVGPNGGGKSTLFSLILGIHKAQQGKIEVLGTTPAKARQRIGYVPQYLSFDEHFPVSAFDLVRMGRLQHSRWGFYTKEDDRATYEAMEWMQVRDIADMAYADLSGGQKQRLLIARAIASQPEFLLLDEPTANIDPAGEARFYDTLRDLNQKMTILIISHDLGFVSQRVNRVVCVNRDVQIHPTSALTGELIQEIYGHSIQMVHHDQCCSEHGHHGGAHD